MAQGNNKGNANTNKPAAAQAGAWYKKWWIWLIAAVVVAGIVIGCVFAFSGGSGEQKKTDPKVIETTVAETTTAPQTTKATAAATTAPKKPSIDEIVEQGFKKVGIVKLHNHINDYKGVKIITAVTVRDLGEQTVYATVDKDSKTLAFYKFELADKNEFKDAKKGEVIAVYGTVSPQGNVGGTVQIQDCHIAAVGDEAKDFLKSLDDEQPTVPTTAPVTTHPTTAPVTTAPATTAPATTAPAPTKAPETTAPATKPTEPPVEPTTIDIGTKTIYSENGVVVTLQGMLIDQSYVKFDIHIDNQSGKQLYVGAMDSSVNGKTIDLIAFELMEIGEEKDSGMFLLSSDLKDAGIDRINSMRFKLILEDPNDWDNPIISDEISLEF